MTAGVAAKSTIERTPLPVAPPCPAWHRPSLLNHEYQPVTLILASRPNVYSSSPLDRVSHKREDAAWIEEKLQDPDTLFVPVWRNRNLVRGMDEGAPEAVFISGEMGSTLHMQGGPWSLLGLHDERAMFAVDISTADDT